MYFPGMSDEGKKFGPVNLVWGGEEEGFVPRGA